MPDVNVTVTLSEEIVAVISQYAPEGASGAEKLEWGKAQMVEGLKLQCINLADQNARLTARNTRNQAHADIEAAWNPPPEDPVEEPPTP